MAKFKITNPIPILAFFALLFSLIFGFLVLEPKFKSLQELGKQIDAQKREKTAVEDYYSGVKDADSELSQHQAELDQINLAIPTSSSLLDMYKYFYETPPKLGVVLKSFSGGNVSDDLGMVGLKEIKFSLQVAGPYDVLKNFLNFLHQNVRIIDIESISFGSPVTTIEQMKSGNIIFNFSLTIKLHSY